MNREEEIIKAAEETSKAMWDFIDDDYTIPFKHGAQWADSHPVNQWHKVEDDLPPQKEKSWLSDDVLAYIKNIGYISAYYNHQRKQWFDVEGNGLVNQTVLYWQPLPELPKEGMSMKKASDDVVTISKDCYEQLLQYEQKYISRQSMIKSFMQNK